MVNRTDMLIVASARPELSAPAWSVFQYPGVLEDLQRTLPFAEDQLDAMWLADRNALAPLLDDWGQPNSDYYPVLDLGAEEARYRGRTANGFIGLASDHLDIAAILTGRRRGFGTSQQAPVPSISRMRALATGAALQAARTGETLDPVIQRGLSSELHRLQRLEAVLADPRPPSDWRLWLADALSVDDDLHRGTAGIADEAFYDSIRRYARRHDAPAIVLDAIAFSHGLAVWDFAEAALASGPLLDAVQRGDHWVSPQFLRDGSVIARIATGDTAGAREASDTLARFDGRAPDDVRKRLVDALLQRVERGDVEQ
jgi:hypothetical protein